MNYSILSLSKVQRLFAVLAILALVFGPFANVQFAQAESWDNWQDFNPDEFVITDYCSDLQGAIEDIEDEINSLEGEYNPDNWLDPAQWELGIKIGALQLSSDFLNELNDEFCTNATVDFCHVPQGNNDKVIIMEDMPLQSLNGHSNHSEDFIIEDAEDLTACEAFVDTDEDSVYDTDDNCPLIANEDQLDTDEDGQGDACDNTPNGPDPVVSLEITNPATDGTSLSDLHTFEAEYTDDDETVDTINWAIKAGAECDAGNTAVNVAGYGTAITPALSYDPVTGHIEVTVDMSSFADGDYCFVVNPQETGEQTDTERAIRTFKLETVVTPPVLGCTDDSALNFSADANEDDGSCSYVCAYSDTTTTINGNPSVITWEHDSWTDELDGGDAEWIWDAFEVMTPNPQTLTFTKTFYASASATGTLTIAVDNFYSAELNDSSLTCAGATGNNHAVADSCPVQVQAGLNTLVIEATNGTGNINAQTNPAGVIFELTTVNATCANTDTTPDPIDPSLSITNPATEGQTLEGEYTFQAEYIDDDGIIDNIQWAIRAGTCAAGTGTQAGNVDGFTDPSTFIGTIFSAIVDMTGWADGDYCFVVNPQEQTGEDNLRATRNFILDDEEGNTPKPDTYRVFGNVWHDENPNNEKDLDEDIFEGWLVTATNGSTTATTTSDENGDYEFWLTEGTWIITQETPEGWEVSYPSDGFWEVTLPFEPVVAEVSFFQSIFNAIIPTAHAMVATINPLNFGNVVAQGNTTPQGGGNGNGRSISLRSSDNDDNGPDGQVEGASTSTLPLGQVLGDATSVMPVGAPNTGAGGASQNVPSAQLHALLAILSATPVRKKHG